MTKTVAASTPEQEKSHAETTSSPATTPTALDRLRGLVSLISQAVKEKDTRALMGRVLRETAGIRPGFDAPLLKAFITEVLPSGVAAKGILLEKLSQVWQAPCSFCGRLH